MSNLAVVKVDLSNLLLLPRAKKEPQSQEIARTAPKNFLNNSRALPNKTRVLRQIAPESSPERSAKCPNWSYKRAKVFKQQLIEVLLGLVIWFASYLSRNSGTFLDTEFSGNSEIKRLSEPTFGKGMRESVAARPLLRTLLRTFHGSLSKNPSENPS